MCSLQSGELVVTGVVDGPDWIADIAESVEQAQADAALALTSANGKNKLTYAPSPPTATGGYVQGDQWWVLDVAEGVARLVGSYVFNSGAWMQQEITSAVIGELDAGIIKTGILEGIEITGGTITSSDGLMGTTQIVGGQLTSESGDAGAGGEAGRISIHGGQIWSHGDLAEGALHQWEMNLSYGNIHLTADQGQWASVAHPATTLEPGAIEVANDHGGVKVIMSDDDVDPLVHVVAAGAGPATLQFDSPVRFTDGVELGSDSLTITASALPNGTNLNSLTSTNVWYLTGANTYSNAPASGVEAVLETNGTSGWCEQKVTLASGRAYRRYAIGTGAWTPWGVVFGPMTSYTPTLGAVALGGAGSSVAARYWISNTLVHFQVAFTLGTGGSVTGPITITPPVPPYAATSWMKVVDTVMMKGSTRIFGLGVTVADGVQPSVQCGYLSSAQAMTWTGPTAPFTWAAGDSFRASATLPIA